jgi:hypothetical protein
MLPATLTLHMFVIDSKSSKVGLATFALATDIVSDIYTTSLSPRHGQFPLVYMLLMCAACRKNQCESDPSRRDVLHQHEEFFLYINKPPNVM